MEIEATKHHHPDDEVMKAIAAKQNFPNREMSNPHRANEPLQRAKIRN